MYQKLIRTPFESITTPYNIGLLIAKAFTRQMLNYAHRFTDVGL